MKIDNKNKNLHRARKDKNDEFYTAISDIEKELQHYKKHFKDKVVLCNCDDPDESNFYRFFKLQFKNYRLKKVITTHYDPEKQPTYKLEIYLNSIGCLISKKTTLKQNGDFRSDESIALLKEADIVVTNPPFSLFREHIAQIIDNDKKFLVIGNNNAITYKEIFKHIKNGNIWLGHTSNKTMEFRLADNYEKWDRIGEDGNKYGKVPAISWFTNLSHKKRNEEIILFQSYNSKRYPKYDNYDAIEVSKVANIPKDYYKAMGVPITFLGKYNPNQFEIIKFRKGNDDKDLSVNDKCPYFRVIIKRKR